jgi:HlyD family secretion protein
MTRPVPEAGGDASRHERHDAIALKVTAGAIALAAVVLVVALWVLGASAAPPARPHFRTAAASMQVFHRVVTATGTIRPVTTTVVGAQVSGTVAEVGADFNGRVRRGQVLVRLDPEGFSARLEQARAQARAAEVARALAADALDRHRRLADSGFVSPAALDQAQGQVEAADAAVRLARAQVRLAEVDLKASVVRSPIDGVVIARNIERGQTISSSFQTPDLFVLAGSLATLKAIVNVTEADAPAVPSQGPAELRVDAWPGRVFPGRIATLRLADNAAQGLVTYPLIVTVDNADGALRPGMTVEARIDGADRRSRLSVPLAAIRWRPAATAATASSPAHPVVPPPVPEPASPDDARVWVSGPDGRPLPRRLTLGAIQGDRVEVLAGPLREGEDVIVGASDGPD